MTDYFPINPSHFAYYRMKPLEVGSCWASQTQLGCTVQPKLALKLLQPSCLSLPSDVTEDTSCHSCEWYFSCWDVTWKQVFLCMLSLWLHRNIRDPHKKFLSHHPGIKHYMITPFSTGCSFWGIHTHLPSLSTWCNPISLGIFHIYLRSRTSGLNWITILGNVSSLIISCLFEWCDGIVDKITSHWLCHTR